MPKKKARKIVKKTVSRTKTAVHGSSGTWERKAPENTHRETSSGPKSNVPESILLLIMIGGDS